MFWQQQGWPPRKYFPCAERRENERKMRALFNPHSHSLLPNGCIFYNLFFDMCVYANPLSTKSYAVNGDGSGFV
jgi:hypothetical protein